MKLSAAQLLLAGASLTSALPHLDSPQQRLLNGMKLPSSVTEKTLSEKSGPYTPGHRDENDNYVDAIGKKLDPKPWRNGLGASVLGPYNRDRSRQSPDMIRPPSTDHGNIANMRWSFTDSHVRIEVRRRCAFAHARQQVGVSLLTWQLNCRKEDGPDRPPSVSFPPASSSLVST